MNESKRVFLKTTTNEYIKINDIERVEERNNECFGVFLYGKRYSTNVCNWSDKSSYDFLKSLLSIPESKDVNSNS